MSEELLKAILHLLAIVAKEDSVTEDERNSIEDFLLENLNKNDSLSYLNLFDQITEQLTIGKDGINSEEDEINSLAKRVNEELTRSQKIVVILKVIEVVVADGEISKREKHLLNHIGESFHFEKDEIDRIKNFVQHESIDRLDDSNTLIVTNSEPTTKEAKHIKRENIKGHLAFYRLENPELFFLKFIGQHPIMLNGIPLKNNKTVVFPAGSSIRSNNLKPLFYSDVVSSFRKEDNAVNISFTAENVSFKFPNGHIGLREINIAESTGQLIGLMGGSGAGKSTLLNVLNGNDTPSEGSVRINGIDIHKEQAKVQGVIGYVPQDDLLVEELSVYDNLYYAAKLCFSNHEENEISKLVEHTLAALGLAQAKDLKVGSPLEKTISGGQRKRLNIGLELLREPSVLFVDEPTSGLSSRDSENIMDLLKELSLKGKMVFVVIHQPSSEIFKMFDKLVILDVGGYQTFYGNPIDAVIYFKSRVDMIDKAAGSCVECGNVNSEQIFDIIETKIVDEFGKITDKRKISPEDWYGHFKENISIPQSQEVSEQPSKTLKIPNRLRQLFIFTKRDLASKFSNKQYLLINLLEAPILATLLAIIIRYIPSSSETYVFSQNPNIPAFFFMAIIVALFMGLTISAEEIFKDRKILKRESFLNLSRLSYLLSKTLILFGLSAFQMLLFVFIGTFILEIQGMGLSFWMVLFSISCFANILGLNISSAFNSAVTIYILIPLLIIPQLILSGVVVNFDKLHPSLKNDSNVPIIGEMMASKWGYEALLVSQYKNNDYKKIFFDYDQTIENSEFKSVYYYSKINEVIAFIEKNMDSQDPNIRKKLDAKIQLLANEMTKELDINSIPKEKLATLDKINIQNLDQSVLEDIKTFTITMKAVYNNRLKKALNAKKDLIASMTDSPEKSDQFSELKEENVNEQTGYFLKNITATERLIEKEGELVKKTFPIYQNPYPSHALDFRTHLFAPAKHFMGEYYDTLQFNVIVIWVMTIILMITLYYDLLRKLINGFNR